MAYKPLALDKDTPPCVRELILKIEKTQFSYVRTVLRILPKNDNLTAGCNFAIAQVLMSVSGGISAILYRPEWKRMDRERFTGVLRQYYPWELEPDGIEPEKTAIAIYEVFRNALIHDLGLDVENKRRGAKLILKRLRLAQEGLSESFIEKELEGHNRYKKMSATLTITSNRQTLLLEALYWGIRRTIEKISADKTRMEAAEKFLSGLRGG